MSKSNHESLTRGGNSSLQNLDKRGGSLVSPGMFPNLQIASMRNRVSKASNIYTSNIKMYQRLSNAKTTIPTIENLIVRDNNREIIKSRLSKYERGIDYTIPLTKNKVVSNLQSLENDSNTIETHRSNYYNECMKP